MTVRALLGYASTVGVGSGGRCMSDIERHIQLVAPMGKWKDDQVIAIKFSNGDRLHVRVIKTDAGQPMVKEAYLLSRDRTTRRPVDTDRIMVLPD